ncbi:MAG: phosphoenolpyruvate--protein phosphotransferase [Spirochaetes bacterium GWF1_31_7]|nr:MAG: phosphoenolpyruvate--protein phosphotransferase [Spirochaetes bacterium GWE1_32_154]OHD46573.1 MAG: phosphoenolpyruvate--protein phosphotransferase [Spirochaetes bacterium GWF1_31_7]OHD49380.1 MAG: phosphoenolpyruvate--protein phosphotransferase [Spirochaetes bacterium GWE2_31_10]
MEIYQGLAASPGIAIGEVFIYNQKLHIPNFSISDYQVEFEIDRFYNALRKTKEEYLKLQQKLIEEMSEDQGKILEAHILMTEDKALIQEVVDKLRAEKKNLESIIFNVVDTLSKKFLQMEDEYFRDRAIDIIDFGKKIIQILLSQKNISLSDINKNVIIISTDLSVSDTASMNKTHVLGFVSELGGKTSHSAIIARSLGIPAILGIKDITHQSSIGYLCIIDGYSGTFILNPDNETIEKYRVLKQKYEEKESEFLLLRELPSITLDNKKILLKANIEIPEQEIESVQKYGAEGVGLYRSEFLYLSKKRKVLPTEEQQFSAYKFILEKFPNDIVTIRTLDLGGDKVLEDLYSKEPNPNLGWRAIRFCLANPEIFKTQLRALYRSSVYGNLQIMLPMISNIDEIEKTKTLIKEVISELQNDKLPYKENIPLGIMIETPAAALLSDELGKIVDFFSIGSNDLIQYVLACDRGNEKIAYLYEPLHPAILKLIKLTIDNAHKNNIKVSICGEMGADVLNALVLIGLGIDEISLSPIKLLEIKKMIRNINYSEIKKIAEQTLGMSNQKSVIELISNWTNNNLKKE